MTATAYRVEFERVGRRRDIAPQTFTAANPDDLAEQVWRFVGRYLGSRAYDVFVEIEDGRGSIEAGRFGTFTIAEVTS